MDVGATAFALWFFTATTGIFIVGMWALQTSLWIAVPVSLAYAVIWGFCFHVAVHAIKVDSGVTPRIATLEILGIGFVAIVGLMTLLIGDLDSLGNLVMVFFMTFTVPAYVLMVILLLAARRRVPWGIWAATAAAVGEYVRLVIQTFGRPPVDPSGRNVRRIASR